jgi:hypothetical protein
MTKTSQASHQWANISKRSRHPAGAPKPWAPKPSQVPAAKRQRAKIPPEELYEKIGLLQPFCEHPEDYNQLASLLQNSGGRRFHHPPAATLPPPSNHPTTTL